MKKTVSLLLVLSCIGALVSCKKETITTATEENTSAALSSSIASDATTSTFATKFGVLVNDQDADGKIAVANELEVNYVRDAIILESYNGKAPMMDQYKASGFKVLLNLNSEHVSAGGSKKANSFPTDMTDYKKSLENVLNTYVPEVAVIENEPFNETRYKGPITDYFTELRTAIDVCHARGIKIADGGLNAQRVCILVYQDYVAQGMQKEADAFAALALKDKNLRAAQGRGSADMNARVDQTKSMIDAYKTMALDYVNIHWYEPLNEDNDPSISAPGILTQVANYLRKATGKEVISNEFGQDNQIPTLVSTMVNEFRLAKFIYAIDWSGKGTSGAQPLHQGTKLLPNGVAYRDAIAQ